MNQGDTLKSLRTMGQGLVALADILETMGGEASDRIITMFAENVLRGGIGGGGGSTSIAPRVEAKWTGPTTATDAVSVRQGGSTEPMTGKEVKDIIGRYGVSYAAFAAKIGVSTATIKHWVRKGGKGAIPPHRAGAIRNLMSKEPQRPSAQTSDRY